MTKGYYDEDARPYGYEIDLEDCNTSGQILDWICQVSQKTWCTPADAGQLVQALNDLLDPQAHVCGCGGEKRFDARTWLKQKRRKENASSWL